MGGTSNPKHLRPAHGFAPGCAELRRACNGSVSRAVKAVFPKSSEVIGLGGMLISKYATKIAEINDSDP